MKNKLLTGITIVCIIGIGPAHSQIAVIDPTNAIAQVKNLAQSAASYLRQGQQLLTEAKQLEQQVQMVMGFIHDPSLGYAMSLMNMVGLSNELPVNPNALMSLTNGYGGTSVYGLMGKASILGSLFNTTSNANILYRPEDGSYSSTNLGNRGIGLSGSQAISLAAFSDLIKHQPIIQALRDKLNTADDPKTVMDAHAQLAAEQVWTSNLGSVIAVADMNAKIQDRVERQRDDERISKDADEFIQQVNASGMGF